MAPLLLPVACIIPYTTGIDKSKHRKQRKSNGKSDTGCQIKFV